MPLDFSEKAALPFEKGFTSQETCRIFQGSHSFGEKSAAVYQHGIQVRGTAAPCTPFRAGLCCTLSGKRKEFFDFVREKMNGEKKEWAVERLKEKSRETGRLPKKEDFDPVTLSRIKAFLGPWPRALEAAGLKERKTAARGGKERK